MTQLAAAVLHLRPEQAGMIPRWTTVSSRAWFAAQMPPDLHQRAHPENERPPYTVANLQGIPQRGRRVPITPERYYRLRFTTLTTELTQWMCNQWLPEQAGKTIIISEMPFCVEQVIIDDAIDSQAGRTTDAELTARYSLQNFISRRIQLNFESPTAFRRDNVTMAMPLPEYVFGNLIRQWNRYNRDVQLHPDTTRFAATCVGIKRHHLRGQSIYFEDETGYPPETGTVGYCQYILVKGDRYWHGVAHTLAAYSQYAGVGIRTAVGMGQVRVMNHEGSRT